jgi:hypothetical protein
VNWKVGKVLKVGEGLREFAFRRLFPTFPTFPDFLETKTAQHRLAKAYRDRSASTRRDA